MKTLAIMIIATVALFSATTVVHAEPSTACLPADEATEASEVACVAAEQEEAEEAEELEYEELAREEAAREELRSPAASSIRSEPAPTSASTPSPSPTTTPKLTACRRASEATIRAEARHIRKLRGKRRRSAERRLDRALCRQAP
jgi:hypothetical protein